MRENEKRSAKRPSSLQLIKEERQGNFNMTRNIIETIEKYPVTHQNQMNTEELYALYSAAKMSNDPIYYAISRAFRFGYAIGKREGINKARKAKRK